MRKRHTGRRVAGVAVGVALIVLGLEAPAFAAPPTIASFTPGSGGDNCVIVVTGTAFQAGTSPINSVTIDGQAADFSVRSGTEIWVAANGRTGFIRVTNTLGEFATTSPTVFNDTDPPDAGDCAPTIESFTPECGTVGTPVTITGTNLISHPLAGFQGGAVEFSPFNPGGVGVTASHTGAPENPTTLVVTVPPNAATGRIQATTEVAEVFSSGTNFTVVTDATQCTGPTQPTRSVNLKLSGKLQMKGKVKSDDADCANGVSVKLQRKKKGGGWNTLKTVTTDTAGAYSGKVKNKSGKYRSLAPATTTTGGAECKKVTSNTRKN